MVEWEKTFDYFLIFSWIVTLKKHVPKRTCSDYMAKESKEHSFAQNMF